MPSSHEIVLRTRGDYSFADSVSLAASASFVSSHIWDADREAGALDLAFPIEGSWKAVGVRVREKRGEFVATIVANPHKEPPARIGEAVERILSLDADGSAFRKVIASDRVLAHLDRRHRGVRPVLYSSPYEAAARAIIGHRLFAKQAANVTARIAEAYGEKVTFGKRVIHAFPAPEELAVLTAIPGLASQKIAQLRVLGETAANGGFTSKALREMRREEALEYVRELPGIGPFSAELIMIRGAGDTDVFPLTEKGLHRAMATVYALGENPAMPKLERIADAWRPYRSWAGLLLRNFWEEYSPRIERTGDLDKSR